MPVITAVLAIGTLAARPAASASNTGFLYCASDLNGGTLFQSNGASWVQIAAAVTQTASGVGAVANAGGAPSLQVGLDAAKPAAGTAGRLYVATDTTIVYEDSGTAWIEVATAAPLWASVVGKPATFAPSAHESTHLSGGSDAIAGLSQSQIAVDTTEAATNDTLAGSLLANLDRLRYQLAQLGTGAWNTLCAMVQLSPTVQQTGTINVSGEVQGSDFKPGGVTGASAAARYHAATATGHPTTGTWQVGDIVPDQTGTFWFCTVAGTPGTWVQVGGTGGAGSSTLAGDTDVAIASPVGGQVLGYSSALSKWVNQNQAGVAATTQTAQLGADVTLTAISTWYDGPSLTLPPGTWLLLSTATFLCPSGGATDFTGRLWDGTTIYASDQVTINTSWDGCMSLSAVVTTSTTTTYKFSVANNRASDGKLLATANNNSSGANATKLVAIQLSGNPVGQQAPAVHAYNTGSLTVPNNVETAIPLDSTRFDQGTTTPQHSTSSNTSRLTCQQAGIYTITGQIAWNGTFANSEVRIRLNGSTDIASQRVGSGTGMSVNVVYQLAVGDYVEMTAFQNSGGNGTIFGSTTIPNYGTEFMMARIDSGPGAVQPNTKVQLDYAASTDLMSNTAISATTWTDLSANQTFTVDDANSVVEIAVSGNCFIGANATNIQRESSSRIVIDSAGTTINKMLGGAICPPVSGQTSYANCLSGANVIEITGLSAGSHTVKVQVYADGASVGYCRASSLPNSEFLAIRVLERKQSVSPPSSTPAPAVRAVQSGTAQSIANATWTALTLDTTTFDQGVSAPQHSTSSNTSRLTCQQAGVYVITGVAGFNSSAAGARRLLRIRVNGTTEIGRSEEPSGGSYFPDLTVCGTYSLAVGDYIELYAYQDTGTTLSVTSPILSMARIDSGGQGFVPIPMVKTANYTATATDGMLVAGASGLTFTLPAASSYGGKAPFVVKNDAFTGTVIAAAGADTIDGAATYSLFAAQASVSLVADPASGKWRSI